MEKTASSIIDTPNIIKNAIKTAESTGYDQYVRIEKDGSEAYGRLYSGISPYMIFGDTIIMRGVVKIEYVGGIPRARFYSAFKEADKVKQALVATGLDEKQVSTFIGMSVNQIRNYIKRYVEQDKELMLPILNFFGTHPIHDKVYNATFNVNMKTNKLEIQYLEKPQDARLHVMSIPFEYEFYPRLEIIRRELTKRYRIIQMLKNS